MTAQRSVHFGAAIAVRLLLAGVAVATATPAASAQVITSTWTGVSGNWTNPALWSTNPNYPNNGNPPGVTYAVSFATQGGTLNVDTPITVQSLQHLLGSTNLTGTQLNVVGQTQVETSGIKFDVPFTTGSLVMDSATLDGSGPITVNGGFGFSGGVVQGSGPFTVAGGVGLGSTGSPSPPVLDGRSLTQTGGSGGWSTASTFTMRNGAVFTVGPGSTFRVSRSNGMSGGTFVVNGSFIADTGFSSGGVGIGAFGSTFINTGSVDFGLTPGGFSVSTGITNSGSVHLRRGGSLSGSIASSGSAAVVNGGGTYSGPLTFSGGRLVPGEPTPSQRAMTVTGAVNLSGGAVFEVTLGGPLADSGYSQLISGSTTSERLGIDTLLAYAPTPADALTIVRGGPVTGTFDGLPNGTEFYVGRFNSTDYVGTITYLTSSIILSNIHAVPEPAAWLLTGVVAIGWAVRRRLRR
jgi:hypothetical protein